MMTFIILAVALTTVVLVLNEYGWTDLTGGTRNNLVFEERNKSYGAYEIRQKYSGRLFVAFIGALGFISIAAVSPKFFMGSHVAAGTGKPADHRIITEVTPPQKPEEKPKEEVLENKVKEQSAPKPPQNTNITPEVIDKPIVKKDSVISTKPIVTDGSNNGDTSLANKGKTSPGPIGGGGNGGGTTPCVDCGPTPPLTGAEVDKMAELKDYQRILMKSIRIPQAYMDMGGKGGKLYVSFIVDENGNVSSASIKKGIDGNLDHEVKRAINAMPRWTPAVKDGKNVPVKMVIPLNIVIAE
ncbi:MAG TPA: TonB family protein [Flavobacteriales bacterium]|nr:TonB family protein [Flavobacteriales bacterium]